MTQPSFWCIANIGDANPLEHGGCFVLVDRTGVYSPELLLLTVDDDGYKQASIVMDELIRIKRANGLHELSDNKFHPDHATWFGETKELQALASFAEWRYENLVSGFLSSSPMTNAFCWRDLQAFHGIENFDTPTKIEDDRARQMVKTFNSQIEEAKSWHEGYGL